MTIALDTRPRPITRRLWNVIRLHAANPFTIIGTPLIILGAIYAVNLVIWWMIRASTDGTEGVEGFSEGVQYSGATLWIFVYMMIVAVQAMNLTFPFALGFGSTRRDFYLGSVISFVGLAAFYSVVFIVMSELERATNGWGLGGAMFSAVYFGIDAPWYLRLFYVFSLFLFFFFTGAAVAAVYVRWKQKGLIGFFLVTGILLVGSLLLLTLTQSWARLGEFFVAIGFTGAYALSLALSVVAGVIGYLIMRRATPRN